MRQVRCSVSFLSSLVTGLFLLVLVCCAFRVAPPPVVLTDANNGTTVTVPAGAQIIVRLPDNAGSTGYAWSYMTQGRPVVTLQGTTYVAPAVIPGSRPRVGAAGSLVFTFMAASSGNASLKFVLQRSWETALPPVQRFGVLIHVTA